MIQVTIHNHLANNFDNFRINHEFKINLVLISVHFEIKAVLIWKELEVRDLDSFNYKLFIMLPFSS